MNSTDSHRILSLIFAQLLCLSLLILAVQLRSDRFLCISLRNTYKCDVHLTCSLTFPPSLKPKRQQENTPSPDLQHALIPMAEALPSWPGSSRHRDADEHGFGESREGLEFCHSEVTQARDRPGQAAVT